MLLGNKESEGPIRQHGRVREKLLKSENLSNQKFVGEECILVLFKTHWCIDSNPHHRYYFTFIIGQRILVFLFCNGVGLQWLPILIKVRINILNSYSYLIGLIWKQQFQIMNLNSYQVNQKTY